MRLPSLLLVAASLAVGCLPDLAPGGDATASGGNGESSPPSNGPATESPSTTDAGDGDAGANACSPSLENDAKNCGSCGRDCRGAACAGGLCVPQDLSRNLFEPFAVVVADGKVFFSTLGPPVGSDSSKTVREVSVEGTGERTLTSSVPGVTDIALTPSLVLFRTWDNMLGGTVRACNRTGACNQTTLVDLIGSGRGLVPASSFFYWGGTFALRRCTVLGCSPPDGVLMQGNVSVEGMVTDGTSLYWTNGRNDYGGFAVYRCTAPACLDGAPLYARATKPTALAIAGATLCWGEKASVVCAPKSGGTPVVVAGGDDALEQVTSVAADENHVYFTLDHDIEDRGRIMRAALTNKTKSAVELAKGQHRPRGVALDATHVFWANAPGDATGSVRRIAK